MDAGERERGRARIITEGPEARPPSGKGAAGERRGGARRHADGLRRPTDMRVRVRGPGGAHTLTVAEDAPLSDLRLQIAEACFQGSSVERRSVFDLRFGFPPKTITSDVDGQQGVLALGIQDGEALQIVNVREDQGSIPDSGRNGGLVSQPTASAETSSRCEPVPQQALYPTSSPPMSGGTNPTGVTLIDGSELVKRVIPSDNSCLFNSVGRVMMDRDRDLRRVVANAVASDPTTYNEVFLEKVSCFMRFQPAWQLVL